MKLNFATKICAILIAFLATNLFADGVVAETNSGKLIKIEWRGYGSEFQQSIQSVDLKIVDKDGRTVLDEAFDKTTILDYQVKKNDDKTVTFKLIILSGTTKINLKFHGLLTNSDSESKSNMDVLVKALRNSKRKISKSSLLLIECSAGKFTFKDVVLGVYGDV